MFVFTSMCNTSIAATKCRLLSFKMSKQGGCYLKCSKNHHTTCHFFVNLLYWRQSISEQLIWKKVRVAKYSNVESEFKQAINWLLVRMCQNHYRRIKMSFAGANVSLNADFIWNNILIEERSGSLHNVFPLNKPDLFYFSKVLRGFQCILQVTV